MAYLDHFSEEDKMFLIQLPYRAGLWISASDTTGGDESDEAERQALANIVRGFTEDFLKSEFVEEVMRETVAHRAEWDGWGENVEAIPAEMREGIELAAQHIDYKQIAAFKSSLMDVAMTVAMAYRELDNTTPYAEQLRIYSRYWLQRVRAYLTKTQPPIMDQFLNISHEEHQAIDALAAALCLKDQEGLEPVDQDTEQEDAA